MDKAHYQHVHKKIPRRTFLSLALTAAAGSMVNCRSPRREPVVIAKAANYRDNLKQLILNCFKELQLTSAVLKGKRVLLKPNLIEPRSGCEHINTHPLLIEAVMESFLHLGAASVVIGEGGGHTTDSYLVIEESGLAEVLFEHKTKFIDFNYSSGIIINNAGRHTTLTKLVIPRDLLNADFVVSMPKMKTHHWAGATLSMKNLFGIMPGSYYGWPKNVLHNEGIINSILDINTSIRPHLAIVDGIIGMEGDGPIMGTPVKSNVVVMGANLTAVDATCARIMGLLPEKIEYLQLATGTLGPISSRDIEQRGEKIRAVQKNFQLLDFIPAHQGLRSS